MDDKTLAERIKPLQANVSKVAPALIAAVAQYQYALSACEATREIVVPYQKRILAENDFQCAPPPDYVPEEAQKDWPTGKLLDPNQTEYLSEEDAERYFALLHVEHIAWGFEVAEVGHCPLLIAEAAVREARWQIVAAVEHVTGISKATFLEHYNVPVLVHQYAEMFTNLVMVDNAAAVGVIVDELIEKEASRRFDRAA